MDTLSTPLLFAVVIFYFVACLVIAFFSKLLHARLRAPVTTIALPDELPPKLVEAFDDFSKSSLPEAFQFSHFMQQEATENSVSTPDWIAVYFNPSEKSYAEIFPNPNPEKAQPFKILFVTVYENLRLMTKDMSEGVISPASGRTEIHRSANPGIRAQWSQHLAQILKTEESQFQAQDRIVSDMCAYTKRRNSDQLEYVEDITEHDYLLRKPDGLKISFKAIKSLLFSKNPKTVKPEKIEKNSLPTDTPEELLNAEHYVFVETLAFNRRVQLDENTRISTRFKIAAFFMSGIFCSVFLAYLFSWEFILFLIPVLLLHEMGHLLAMMAFGYKRKFMLFMPLGAFVIGEKKYAPTWQEMTVFLAGPVPGILLALGLLSFLPEISDRTWSFIVMLLLINCFNLLPVMPLDGGQMVNLAISHRYPKIQFALHLLSLAITLLPAVLLQDPILFVLAAWLLLAVPSSYRKIVMFQSAKEFDNSDNQTTLVEHIFTSINKQKINFSTRYEEIKYIISCSQTIRSTKKSSMVFGLYALALIAPLAFIAANTNDSMGKLLQGSQTLLLDTGSNSLLSAEEQKKHIMESNASNDDKIYALQMAVYDFDSHEIEQSIDYLELALSLTNDSSEPDYYEQDLFSSLHSFYLEADDLEGAENIRQTSVEKSIHNPDFTPTATYLYQDLYDHYSWSNATDQHQIISQQNMDTILHEISSMQEINPEIEIAKAHVYSARAYETDLPIDQQIALTEEAMRLHIQHGDLYEEQNSANRVAELYFKSGQQKYAFDLLNTLLEKPSVDDYSKIPVYYQLADLYLANANFDMAENVLQKAHNIYEQNGLTYINEDIAWLNVFKSDLVTAHRVFTNSIIEREKQFDNRYDELGLVMKVALKSIDSTEYSPNALEHIPFLAIAHAQDNADLAIDIHAQIQSMWQEYSFGHDETTLIEYYEQLAKIDSMPGSLEARKTNLIISALEYVEKETTIRQ